MVKHEEVRVDVYDGKLPFNNARGLIAWLAGLKAQVPDRYVSSASIVLGDGTINMFYYRHETDCELMARMPKKKNGI